jgi:hypothetical protein
MSTVKVDSVVGSFLPLPVIKHANDVETYQATAGQTQFTTTKFNRSSTIRAIANVDGVMTDVAASWTATNTVTISGITLTLNQVVYIFSVGALATDIRVLDPVTGNWVTIDQMVSNLSTTLNTTINTLTARMHAVALSF